MLENLNTVDSVIRDKRFPFGHVLLCGCSQTQNDYWYDNYFLTVMCIAGARQNLCLFGPQENASISAEINYLHLNRKLIFLNLFDQQFA